ncbi:hypothetical protein [Methylomonas albis]|nr:hypothetical protein [Methylomonas albis]
MAHNLIAFYRGRGGRVGNSRLKPNASVFFAEWIKRHRKVNGFGHGLIIERDIQKTNKATPAVKRGRKTMGLAGCETAGLPVMKRSFSYHYRLESDKFIMVSADLIKIMGLL